MKTSRWMQLVVAMCFLHLRWLCCFFRELCQSSLSSTQVVMTACYLDFWRAQNFSQGYMNSLQQCDLYTDYAWDDRNTTDYWSVGISTQIARLVQRKSGATWVISTEQWKIAVWHFQGITTKRRFSERNKQFESWYDFCSSSRNNHCKKNVEDKHDDDDDDDGDGDGDGDDGDNDDDDDDVCSPDIECFFKKTGSYRVIHNVYTSV